MPRLRFKNFSDFGFIQGLDKPRCLGPFLVPHAAYFTRQGVDVTSLKNDDATDRRLLQVFTQPDEGMPTELLEALYVIDDLADEAGHDQILDEARRQGVSLDGKATDLTPGEFAISIHCDHPGLIQVCHEKTLYRKVKNYQEYQSKGSRKLKFETVEKKRGQIEEALAPWFESKNRSRACEIYAYEEDEEIKILVTHGRTLRTEGSIDKRLRRSRVAYRPQKHDMVIYDNRTFVLKVNAQTLGEKDLYRETMGKILFDALEYFPHGDLYTLTPLSREGDAVRLVKGIESARLGEVWIAIDDDQHFTQVSKAYNLMESIRRYGKPNLEEGRIVRASFLMKYSSGGRARKLEIRPPNVAIYDRDRDGDPAEAFMRVNGYLKLGPNGDGARA